MEELLRTAGDDLLTCPAAFLHKLSDTIEKNMGGSSGAVSKETGRINSSKMPLLITME